jgi:hypothetical protein
LLLPGHPPSRWVVRATYPADDAGHHASTAGSQRFHLTGYRPKQLTVGCCFALCSDCAQLPTDDSKFAQPALYLSTELGDRLPQSAQIALRDALPHRVGHPIVLVVAIRKKLFRLSCSEQTYSDGFGKRSAECKGKLRLSIREK